MLQGKCIRRLDKKDTLQQALSNLIIIILVEMLYLILLILPPVKTGLKRVRMTNAHTVDLGSYSILLIFGDAIGAL